METRLDEMDSLLTPEQVKIFTTLAPRFKSSGLIKALLTASGLRVGEVARRIGHHPADVSKVISGTRRNQRIRDAIAQELGLKAKDLWQD